MLQYVSYQVHITFFYPTVISGGGGAARAGTGEQGDNPVGTVQVFVVSALWAEKKKKKKNLFLNLTNWFCA